MELLLSEHSIGEVEILEIHGMEYVKAKSRSGAIVMMLQPALLTIMPNPFLKSGMHW